MNLAHDNSDFDQIETKSDKLLFQATASGDFDALKRVLDSGKVHVDCKNEDGTTPLMIACAKGYRDCVALLLEEGADPCESRNSGTHALFFASQSGHLDIVVALVQNQPRCVKIRGQDGGTAVFVACQFGHLRIVEYLYESGSDVNLEMIDGATPLFIAAQNGHADIVKFLMAVGADVNKSRKDKATPLWISAQMGYPEVVRLLLEAGADPDAAREDGATPLFKASHKGYLDVAEELLKHKPKLGLIENGETPLHAASLFGHLEVVKRLVASGADPNLKNKSGELAADLARQTGHFDVADLLSNTQLRR